MRRPSLIALVIALIAPIGVALALAPAEIYFNGDAGLKALYIRTQAAGAWTVAFNLTGPPWVRELWADGLFPFTAPFVYAADAGYAIGFPPLFLWLSMPFFRAFGEPGLYVLPVFGCMLTAVGTFLLVRRLGLSERASALAIVAVSIGSPLFLYSAIIWEHSLAVALMTLAFALVLGGRPWQACAGGLLVGIAVMLRPEAIVLGGVTGAVFFAWPVEAHTRKCLIYAALSGGTVLVFYGILNDQLTGSPLGFHAQQSMTTHKVLGVARRLAAMVRDLILFFPLVLILPLAVRHRPLFSRLTLAGAFFVLIAAFIVPNSGGKQWGPRYLFVAFPLFAAAAAPLVGAAHGLKQLAAPAVVLLGVGINAVYGSYDVALDYRTRIAPLLALIRARPEPVVAVSHQWHAMELSALYPERILFRVEGLTKSAYDDQQIVGWSFERADRLARGLSRAGIADYLFVCFDDDDVPRQTSTTSFEKIRSMTPYAVYRARVFAAGPSTQAAPRSRHPRVLAK